MSPRELFHKPETKRLSLSDDQWVEVKAGLNAGDARRMDSLAVKPLKLEDGTVVDRIDWSMYEFERDALWITDWSFSRQDSSGKVYPIPVSVAALQALDLDVFNELNDSVFSHIMQWIGSKGPRRTTEGTLQAAVNASPTSAS